MADSVLMKLNDSHLTAVFSYDLEGSKGGIAVLMAPVWWLDFCSLMFRILSVLCVWNG